MKQSTHQLILQICAQLDAVALPISVGLVKAKSPTTLPLPMLIKSINAYKGGERAVQAQSEPSSNQDKNKVPAVSVPQNLEELIQLVLQQQQHIETLQAQVTALQSQLKA